MRILLLLSIFFISSIVYSQESWDYLPIEIDNYHGAIYPIDENVVHVVSDHGKFYKTVDGGETWSQFDSGVDQFFFDLAFDGPTNGYAVGNHGNILKTTNSGQSWYTISSGTDEALISLAINSENSIWVVGLNGTLLHSSDGGGSWTSNSSLTSEQLNSINFKDKNIGYIAGNNGELYYTDNAGTDWAQINISTTNNLSKISITDSYVYFLSGYGGSGGENFTFSGQAIYKSNDNETWIETPINDFLSGATDMVFLDDSLGFMISSEALLCDCCFVLIKKTVDGASSWIESLDEETNSANCHANPGYADIEFLTPEVGYALLGPNILKTPYQNSTGIEKIPVEKTFTLFPNPARGGNFNLKITSTKLEGLFLEIVDMSGKKIYSRNNLKETNIISIANISEGIYFVKLLKNGKLVEAQKLIINK